MTMAAQITAILAQFTSILTALVGGVGDVAEFMITNPLVLIGVGFSLTGLVIGMARGFVRH